MRARLSCSPACTSARPQIYTDMVAAGRLPTRPGSGAIIAKRRTPAGRWPGPPTSAEPSGGILDQAVGQERARRFDLVLAGDVVAQEKAGAGHLPARPRASRCSTCRDVVIEDSRNGLLPRAAAGLRTVMTVNGYTEGEDSRKPSWSLPPWVTRADEQARVRANAPRRTPAISSRLADLERCPPSERVIPHRSVHRRRSVWQTRRSRIRSCDQDDDEDGVDNDGLFRSSTPRPATPTSAYSLAPASKSSRRTGTASTSSTRQPAAQKISMIISRHVGGCSGPDLGHGFLRAGCCGERTDASRSRSSKRC